MSSRSIQWLQALSALAAEGLEPAEAGAFCAHIEKIERSRTLRASPGFRLLRLACRGRPASPEAWVLRFAMGRALATQADPERKPGFTLQSACCLLGERIGSALALLATAGARPLAGGLILRDDEGQLTLAYGLASWLLTGQILLPGLEPITPRGWLLEQPAVQATAQRVGGLVDANGLTLTVLTSTEPLLASALGATIGRSRGRQVRCWTMDDARRGPVQPLAALRWIGAVEGFDPMVVLLPDEERGPWSENALCPPIGHPHADG